MEVYDKMSYDDNNIYDKINRSNARISYLEKKLMDYGQIKHDINELKREVQTLLDEELDNISKLENKQKKYANTELQWAMEQISKQCKTDTDLKALNIIQKELGLRKTSLRPKPVKNR